MHAFANAIPAEDGTVELPSLDDYSKLDTFSAALEEYRNQQRELQQTQKPLETHGQENIISLSRRGSIKSTPRTLSAISTRSTSPVETSTSVILKDPKRAAPIPSPETSPESNDDEVDLIVEWTAKSRRVGTATTKGTEKPRSLYSQTPATPPARQALTNKEPVTSQHEGVLNTGSVERLHEPIGETSNDSILQTEDEEERTQRKNGKRPRNRAKLGKRAFTLDVSDDDEEETKINAKDKTRNVRYSRSFMNKRIHLENEIEDDSLSNSDDTTVMEMGKVEMAPLYCQTRGGSKLSTFAVTNEAINKDSSIIVMTDSNGRNKAMTVAGGRNGSFDTANARDSELTGLSTTIFDDGVNTVSIKQVRQPRPRESGRSRKVSNSVEITPAHQGAVEATAQSIQQVDGSNSSTDPETVDLEEPETDEAVSAEFSSQRAKETVAIRKRGQRMFLVAVELKERQIKKRKMDGEYGEMDQAPQSIINPAQTKPAAAQKRPSRDHPSLNSNKRCAISGSKAEKKSASNTRGMVMMNYSQSDDGTNNAKRQVAQPKRSLSSTLAQTDKKGFPGERHSLTGIGNTSLPTAEGPGEPPISPSQPKSGISDEKLNAMLGKTSWRHEFAGIKPKKKPKAQNQVVALSPETSQTTGEEAAPRFQSSHSTSPVVTHHSVSMPIEAPIHPLSSPYAISPRGYSPYQQHDLEYDHGRSNRRRERGRDHDRRYGDRKRDRDRDQGGSKSHRRDDKDEARSRRSSGDVDEYGKSRKAQGDWYGGDWGRWSQDNHFSPARGQSPSEVQSSYMVRSPSEVPSPEIRSPSMKRSPSEVPSPEIQSPSMKRSPSEVPSPEIQSPSMKRSPSVVRSPPSMMRSPSVVRSPPSMMRSSVVRSPLRIQLPSVLRSPVEIQSPPIHSPSEIQSFSEVQPPFDVQSPSVIFPPPEVESTHTIRSPSKVLSMVLSPKRSWKNDYADANSSERRPVVSGTIVDLPEYHPHDYLRGDLSDG
ncbi:hypothetical protein BGZ65_001522 [Modicella reniformis]|uniref:Uncharacterized protein n=1 Tax=Modicella reniformis TaxID=1440133 RepID=A0A9P6M9V9_9FUNG|nr:hypothetical protein BGZ65_001522 [Modicella reniformis]